MAAGIAHEINTPAQYMGDNTRFLKDSFGELLAVLRMYEELRISVENNTVTPEMVAKAKSAVEEADIEYLLEEIPPAIEQSLDGTKRISEIVLAMKEFSHPGTGEKVATNINKSLETTITV